MNIPITSSIQKNVLTSLSVQNTTTPTLELGVPTLAYLLHVLWDSRSSTVVRSRISDSLPLSPLCPLLFNSTISCVFKRLKPFLDLDIICIIRKYITDKPCANILCFTVCFSFSSSGNVYACPDNESRSKVVNTC